MPRANRHHLSGQVWHITHRCHQRSFLFRFARDRKRWVQWLYESKKRYGLSVLDYVVTSNHIHLLIVDEEEDVVSRILQLVAGRTAQEYNQRKARTGAFWEDRYHATAIESGEHLVRCLAYIDMNMVRAGVVSHPSEWQHGGYHEIQSPPCRYRLIDRSRLIELTGASDDGHLRRLHREWLDESLQPGRNCHESAWSEAVAVGGFAYVEMIRRKLGLSPQSRWIEQSDDRDVLREPESSYMHNLQGKNAPLSDENAVYFDGNIDLSIH